MLTDKQSLILCAILALGFSACGIIDVLDNYAVIGVLIVGFLILLTNIFIVLKNRTSQEDDDEKSDNLNDMNK